jgi:alpha-1,3-rhamnosyl/mannosyltransferase
MSASSSPLARSRAPFAPEARAQPIRVAVNARCLLSPLTGIGQYTNQLMRALSARRSLEFCYFYGHSWGREIPSSPTHRADNIKNLARLMVPNFHEVARRIQGIEFRRGARKLRCALYHDPNFLPFDFPGPIVNSVHDLSFVRFPDMHPKPRRQLMERHLPGALERSQCVVTDSLFVRDELVAIYGTPTSKIYPIHLGVSEDYGPRTPDETRAVLSAYGLTHGRYVLAVGTLEPRKNLIQGLRAYRRLPTRLRESMPFVIVGMKGWLSAGIEAEIRALETSGLVRPLGYVTNTELCNLYAGAVMLVYPSIYEGFGLPALEAMASGTPVITSDRSSLPEVVGDAGIVLDPGDQLGLAEAMQRLAEDAGERASRSRAGLERARQFTWGRCAEETERVYRIALAGG